jgi:hypothetical protein
MSAARAGPGQGASWASAVALPAGREGGPRAAPLGGVLLAVAVLLAARAPPAGAQSLDPGNATSSSAGQDSSEVPAAEHVSVSELFADMTVTNAALLAVILLIIVACTAGYLVHARRTRLRRLRQDRQRNLRHAQQSIDVQSMPVDPAALAAIAVGVQSPRAPDR